MALLLRLFALALLAVVVLLALAGLLSPWSLSGWLALSAVGLACAAALASAPATRRTLLLLSGAALLAWSGARGVALSRARVRMVTGPAGQSARWLGAIVDEQDVSLVGARALSWLWSLPRDERAGLVDAMRSAYVQMRDDAGLGLSPVLDTWLARQGPRAFDTLWIEAEKPATSAVLFLHGYAGSFALTCWLVARAARAIDAVTVCPATGFAGHWGEARGERTVRATLAMLRARGIRRVYLAGLSNGGVGAIALAPRLAASLVGLIVISGAHSDGDAAGLPTLVVQGERDTRVAAAAARSFAARAHARYAGFDGGHFVLLMRREETLAAITAWLRAQEAKYNER
jgi:esterase/lipase